MTAPSPATGPDFAGRSGAAVTGPQSAYRNKPPACVICVPTDESGSYLLDDDDGPFPCATLRLLAQPYRDHPDFDPSWLT